MLFMCTGKTVNMTHSPSKGHDSSSTRRRKRDRVGAKTEQDEATSAAAVAALLCSSIRTSAK